MVFSSVIIILLNGLTALDRKKVGSFYFAQMQEGGDDMARKKTIAIICAFSIVFAVSSGFLIKHYYDSAKQAEMYDNLIEVVEPEPEETKEPMNYSEEKTFIPEYQELYLQNNDMVGWIKVEDTKINYPVMQSKDNPNFYPVGSSVIYGYGIPAY